MLKIKNPEPKCVTRTRVQCFDHAYTDVINHNGQDIIVTVNRYKTLHKTVEHEQGYNEDQRLWTKNSLGVFDKGEDK